MKEDGEREEVEKEERKTKKTFLTTVFSDRYPVVNDPGFKASDPGSRRATGHHS